MSAAEVKACQNTDRELYREPWPDPPGDFYAPSIHVTARGGIGISVGGTCFVMPLRAWHELAKRRGVESPQREPTEGIEKPPEASSGTPSGGEQAPNPGSGAATEQDDITDYESALDEMFGLLLSPRRRELARKRLGS